MNRADYKTIVEEALKKSLEKYDNQPQAGLAEAMKYSLLAGGKRIRPVLVLEFCRISGGDPYKAIPAACGIEMLHTYSLIHDDLPCMDNDDLRRGKPTNHVVFGECTATLAGDALQAEAFSSILSADLPAQNRADCAKYLADAVGAGGMCGGQYLDTEGEGKELSAQDLQEINSRKTGALLVAACTMGVACAGGSEIQRAAAECYGAALGAAFQIKDDILDVIGDQRSLGKPIGSDEKLSKNTYMALYGREKCESLVLELTETAKNAVRDVFEDSDYLCDLADSLCSRKS